MLASVERSWKHEADLPSQPPARSGCGRIKTLASGARKILDAPLSSGNWYQKIVLWPFLVLIGLPLYFFAFCLAILPFLACGALLFLQTDLYLQEKHWYPLSLLDVATQTVDQKLSDEIGLPALSSCPGPRKVIFPGQVQQKRLKEQPCPQLEAWQRWLVYPRSRLDLHRVLVVALNLISVPMVLFVLGLLTWHLFLQLRETWQPEAAKPVQTQLKHLQHYQVVLRH